MKKLVIIALALFLALPAITFAGSATSRWDMTIGGYVKADMGWSDQGLGPDSNNALRKSNSATVGQNIDDEYGSFFMTGLETRMNFLVKGPDAWGAKTSSFIEFDFRGYQNSDRGGANLRHAFMKFDWANDSLLIGRFWAPNNMTPMPFAIGIGDLPEAKNGRTEQITWGHKWGKKINTSLGLINGGKSYGASNTSQGATPASRSMTPWLAGDINYKSDGCGKIGPNMMTFGASGIIGYTKETWNTTANGRYDDQNVKSYSASVYTFVPIIPEKNANKANALAFSGGAMLFSNLTPEVTWGPVSSSYITGPYARGAYSAVEVAPTYASFWAALTYYFTDKFQVNGIYANTHVTNGSIRWQTNTPNNIMSNDTYMLSFAYDVNPAIRLGAQLTHYFTKFAADGGTAGANTGSANMARFAAYYYF